MAFRAGAEIGDMEFIQFHPTALYLKDAPRFLLSEALRGEGAYLRNDAMVRFMAEYHPLGELAPRDVVARAITQRAGNAARSDGSRRFIWTCGRISMRSMSKRVFREFTLPA